MSKRKTIELWDNKFLKDFVVRVLNRNKGDITVIRYKDGDLGTDKIVMDMDNFKRSYRRIK